MWKEVNTLVHGQGLEEERQNPAPQFVCTELLHVNIPFSSSKRSFAPVWRFLRIIKELRKEKENFSRVFSPELYLTAALQEVATCPAEPVDETHEQGSGYCGEGLAQHAVAEV